jgi:hypothetical protein
MYTASITLNSPPHLREPLPGTNAPLGTHNLVVLRLSRPNTRHPGRGCAVPVPTPTTIAMHRRICRLIPRPHEMRERVPPRRVCWCVGTPTSSWRWHGEQQQPQHARIKRSVRRHERRRVLLCGAGRKRGQVECGFPVFGARFGGGDGEGGEGAQECGEGVEPRGGACAEHGCGRVKFRDGGSRVKFRDGGLELIAISMLRGSAVCRAYVYTHAPICFCTRGALDVLARQKG